MMTVQEAARALHAEWRGADVLFSGVSTDSRTVGRGDLFVALAGEKFDGHRFVAGAKAQGAVAAMINVGARQASPANPLPEQQPDIPLIQVKDTRLGLGQLAAHWRGRFSLPLVAVTGSNGKTTVKEMIASILRQAAGDADRADGVLATEGNLNNDIGVPQMLLRLRAQHAYAVIEMGMNHPGEIAYLTGLAKPTVALVNNAGAAHLEGLGSVEAVARAKGEIFAGLDAQGVAVINADDPHAALWRELAGNRRVVDFCRSENTGARVSARYQLNPIDSEITLILPDGSEQVKLAAPGVHNVSNALAAAAVAVALGIGKETIAAGLNQFKGVKGRMQKKSCLHGATLIDDTYNANPESVRAALAVLAAVPGKKFLVLGDMGELGENAAALHGGIGEEARRVGIDRLFALGELSVHTVAKFGEGARHFERIEELLTEVENLLAPDVTLLVKGSRFMQMERVVKSFEVPPCC